MDSDQNPSYGNEIHDIVAAGNSNSWIRSIRRFYEETFPPRILRKVFAEIIATFLLVFVTCGSAGLSHNKEQTIPKLGASVAGGLIVTVMIYSVGHISGAHMNPAVTLAFAAVRHFPWKQVPFYVIAQLTGALVASFTLRLLLAPLTSIGITIPSGTHVQALVMEIIVTFTMMFVTSAVATDTRAVIPLRHVRLKGSDDHGSSIIWFLGISVSLFGCLESYSQNLGIIGLSVWMQGFITWIIGELAGIAVGSAVTISSIFAGPISGGSMNPARSIGPAIANNVYKGIWVYLVGPVLGTLLGAWSYSLIRFTDKPLHAISMNSSLKLRRLQSDDQRITDNKDPFEDL